MEPLTKMRARREALSISQKQLAEIAGISLRSLKALESGVGNPTLHTLLQVAEVLGVEIQLKVKEPTY